ncbi:LysM domain-containing protein [Bacillus carboniphilus]|uniref:LysM domain-containing protein n=1 Tax=Bacillus carboniphilus TaxID=86663 RepID=A0ABY9JQY8_9BACI|nr:LysM domain-containing protein [Bacillus carboniphilus]WLR41815.1 LysM domain-containing protein [Bacillus carboniphilus]
MGGKASKNVYYFLKKGDTLSEIAKAHNVSVDKLAKLNKLENPNLLIKKDKSDKKHAWL